jgi:hypothetical protein
MADNTERLKELTRKLLKRRPYVVHGMASAPREELYRFLPEHIERQVRLESRAPFSRPSAARPRVGDARQFGSKGTHPPRSRHRRRSAQRAATGSRPLAPSPVEPDPAVEIYIDVLGQHRSG